MYTHERITRLREILYLWKSRNWTEKHSALDILHIFIYNVSVCTWAVDLFSFYSSKYHSQSSVLRILHLEEQKFQYYFPLFLWKENLERKYFTSRTLDFLTVISI